MSGATTVESAYSAADDLEQGNAAEKGLALRWWPALAIVLAMVALKFMLVLFDAPPLPVLMLSFMGPGLLSLAIPLWWLALSRAPGRERILGIGVLALIAVGTIAISHKTILGMGTMMYQMPVGMIAFALPLILLAGVSSIRLPVAILSAVIGFGLWDTLQMRGTTGKFAPEFASRWSESEEDKYLAELANRKLSNPEPIEPNLVSNGSEINLRAEAEWPDFRGADRSGVVTKVTLNSDWESNPPKLVWKTRVGPGWSSFSAMDGRLFTQEQRGEKEAVVCLDASTGKQIWAHEYPARFEEVIGGAGPRATPTIGKKAIYSLGANGRLSSIDAATGAEKWHQDLAELAEREPPTWGWSASPLVVSDLVIVHAGGAENKGLFAFEAESGDVAWSVESGDHTYSSAQLATFDGIDGALMACNQGLRFHSLEDGSAIWYHEWPCMNYRATQPLVMGNEVLLGTSLGLGTRKLVVSKSDSDWNIETKWTSRAMKPDYNDFVVFNGNLYGFDGNIFACAELEAGKKLWKRGRYGNGQVVLLEEAGQLLVISEKGKLVLLEANPKELVELAEFEALEGKTWNHPVVIGTQIFLRNGKEAACYELPVVGASSNSMKDEPGAEAAAITSSETDA